MWWKILIDQPKSLIFIIQTSFFRNIIGNCRSNPRAWRKFSCTAEPRSNTPLKQVTAMFLLCNLLLPLLVNAYVEVSPTVFNGVYSQVRMHRMALLDIDIYNSWHMQVCTFGFIQHDVWLGVFIYWIMYCCLKQNSSNFWRETEEMRSFIDYWIGNTGCWWSCCFLLGNPVILSVIFIPIDNDTNKLGIENG